MAINFRTDTVILTKQQVRASGANSMLYVNGIEVIAGISGNLTQTGVQLGATIASTGSQAWNHGQNNALNLSGNLNASGRRAWDDATNLSGNLGLTGQTVWNALLTTSGNLATTGSNLQSQVNTLTANLTATGAKIWDSLLNTSGNVASSGSQLGASLSQTGSTLWQRDLAISGALQAQIIAADADVNSINGQSGTITISGTGNITVLSGGPGVILISGDTGAYANFATRLDLTQTGSTIWNALLATSGNLAASGSSLDVRITNTGATIWGALLTTSGNLANTGSNLQSQVNTLTANLTATGSTIWSALLNTSGNLVTTGSTLAARDLSISGGLEQRIFLTGAAAISYANAVSGGLESRIAITGQTAWTHGQNNAVNLSGNLTATGATIWNALLATSGNLAATGAALVARDLSISGALQAQIQAATAGVTSLNGQTGVVLVLGTGGLSVLTGGLGIILISGDNSISGALSQTGSTIWNALLTTSGNLASTGLQLTNSLSSTGAKIWDALLVTSGNLAATGSSLDVRITNTGSTVWNALLTTSGNLASTGSQLSASLSQTGSTLWQRDLSISGALQALINNADADVNSINGQSGVITILGTGGLTVLSGGVGLILVSGDQSISGALSQTGSTIWTALLNTSGNLATTGATAIAYSNAVSGGLEARIALTGQTAWTHSQNNALNLSGNLTATGATVWNALLTTSGNLASTGSNLQGQVNTLTVNLTNTGSTIWNALLNTSGNLVTTGATLIARDAALSGQLRNDLVATGSTLFNIILSQSGLNDAVFVHKTGVETVGGTKTFANELRFNSGLKTPVQFFGLSNYSLVSGNHIVIATGNLAGVTGILPSPVDYSGVLFTLINGGSNSLQISGTVGPDVNPLLAPWDSYELYATSGQWWPIRQTGSPLAASIVALSGYIGVTSGIIRNDIVANAINLSGNLTATGATIWGALLNTSGNLASTGQQAWTNSQNNALNLSGNINASGRRAWDDATNLSGNLTTTGAKIWDALITTSGNLAATGSALAAQIIGVSGVSNVLYGLNIVYTTGNQSIQGDKYFNTQDSTITTFDAGASRRVGFVKAFGLSPKLMYSSGTTFAIQMATSGGALTAASASGGGFQSVLTFDGNGNVLSNQGYYTSGSAVVLQSQTGQFYPASNPSGYVTGLALYQTGSILDNKINSVGLTLSGNITSTGATIWNALILNSGNLVTTGQTLYNLITAGSGQANINYAPAAASYVYQSGSQIISGMKVFSSGIGVGLITGFGVGIGSRPATIDLVANVIASSGTPIARPSIDWYNRLLIDSNGADTTVDWRLRKLYSFVNVVGVDWNAGTLATAAGTSLDWNNNILSGDWVTNTSLTNSGSLVNFYRLTGASGTLQGNLVTTGQNLTAVKVTGSSIINNVNFTGLGGTLIFSSGSFVFISGATSSAGGGITQGQLDSVSGWTNSVFVHRTGDELVSGSKTFTILGTGKLMVASGDQEVFSVSVDGTTMKNAQGAPVFSSASRTLTVPIGATALSDSSIDWGARTLYDTNNAPSVKWGALTLIDGISTTLNWAATARTLSGNWTTNSNLVTSGTVVNFFRLSGASGALETKLASTGQQAWDATNNNGINLSGNLTLTGQTLRALTLSVGASLSGNLTTTGQTLYNLLTNASGYQESIFVHRTGAELVSGQKTFASAFGAIGLGLNAFATKGSSSVVSPQWSWGANGSVGDFYLIPFDNAGSTIDNPFIFERAAGGPLRIYRPMTIESGITPGIPPRLGINTTSGLATLHVGGTSYFSGNVGIGTFSPTQLFDNTGTSRFRQNLYFDVIKQSGDFTVSNGKYRYVWSGDGLYAGTGTMPSPSTLSGAEFIIKNITTGNNLLLSGTFDYYQNCLVPPRQSVNTWSDGTSWILT